ncbi:MAG: hypothetical protein JOZ74_15145 [Bradyrhizobium sp.]|nr:hypothetical protein [Bradyrhizobium sp.]
MAKDKSILDKFTETMKGLADSASQALKPEEPPRVDETGAAYMPFAAEGLVSDPLLPVIATRPARTKRRTAKKPAKRRARATGKSAASKSAKKPARKLARGSVRERSRAAAGKSATKTSPRTAKRGGAKKAPRKKSR